MVQVDLPAAFTVGQVFALLSRKYLRGEADIFKHKLLGPLNFYLACCFSPVGLFLLIGWPAWEVMYVSFWVEKPFDRPLVAGFYVLFVVVMIILGNVGFILAHHWYRKGKDKFPIYGSVIGAVLTFLPFLLKWGVWWNIGPYSEVKAGGGYSFWAAPFFPGWLVVMSYLAVTTVLAGIWFRKMGDRLGA